jgi:hypothetical protein
VPAAMILHRGLAPLLQHLHSRGLAGLLAAGVACVSGPRLTLTDGARRREGSARWRPRIKRADRRLGNHHWQGEARSI